MCLFHSFSLHFERNLKRTQPRQCNKFLEISSSVRDEFLSNIKGCCRIKARTSLNIIWDWNYKHAMQITTIYMILWGGVRVFACVNGYDRKYWINTCFTCRINFNKYISMAELIFCLVGAFYMYSKFLLRSKIWMKR